jgi:eukaryotic-like serine/threonine-protein kinase
MKRCPACSMNYDDDLTVCPTDKQELVDFETNNGTSSKAQIVRPEDNYLGKTLNNKFRIDALLGRGGMGAVYRATDTVLDRIVAVKLLRQDLIGSDNFDTRFLREARAAARIEHPHAITVHDFGTLPDGGAFIVMEFIHGQTLRDLLKREGRLEPSRAMELIKQTCSAVAAAHQVGVIHRDLKPENIMLKNIGTDLAVAKVVDFGLAKLKENVSPSIATLTGHGEIVGTPYYMSPEQCAGSEVDERSDIYSLGIIFYEVLTGKPPFNGVPVAVIGMHLYKPVPLMPEFEPKIPAVFEQLILEMLGKEKEKRPPTLKSILSRLDQFRAIPALLVPQLSSDLLTEFADNSTNERAVTMRSIGNNGDDSFVKQVKDESEKDQPAAVTKFIADESQPTVLYPKSPTQNQNADTAIYNSSDFKTRSLESPAAAASAEPSSAKTSLIRPYTAPIAERKKSHKKLYLIGAIGLLIGAAFVFFLLPLSVPAPPTSRPSIAAPDTASRPVQTPESGLPTKEEKQPAINDPKDDPTPSASAPRTDPAQDRQQKRNTEADQKDKEEKDGRKGGIIRKVGKSFKEGFGLFKSKKDKEKKEDK